MAEKKTLRIKNLNNKLGLDGFLHIQFAPPRETVTEKDFDTVFEVFDDGGAFFGEYQMLDFLRLPLHAIGNLFTVPVAGQSVEAWRDEWFARYPECTRDTELAVYCFKKRIHHG